jgi:hypothetical protein
VLAHNLRHPDALLDQESSSWPEVYHAILQFLRHQLSQYDARLREQSYDLELRGQLAGEVARAAFQKYRWLRLEPDPRPFPETSKNDELMFDRMARHLTELCSRRDQIQSAMRDLRRSPGHHGAN